MTIPARRMLVPALLASLTAALASCAAPPHPAPGTPTTLQGLAVIYRLAADTAADTAAVLFHAPRSGFDAESTFAVRDAATWAAVWRRLQRETPTDPAPPAPSVDFAREQVLVVASGDEPSTGHEVLVDSVAAANGGLVAYATRYAPATGCLAGSMITAPAHAVRVASSLERVTFVVRDAAAPECGTRRPVLRLPPRRGAHR